MQAIIERDFLGEASKRRFFLHRSLTAIASGVGLVWAWFAHSNDPGDVIGQAAFTASSLLLLTTVLLLLPPAFAQLLARERASDTLSVLLTTPLSGASLIVGAWLSRVCLASLLVLAGLPFVAVSMVYGGVLPSQFLALAQLLLVTLVWVSAVSLLVGGLVRNLVSASRAAYLVVFAAVVIPPLLADELLSSPYVELGALLHSFSPYSVLDAIHQQSFGVRRGGGDPLLVYTLFGVAVAVICLLWSMRAVRREAERSDEARLGFRLARIVSRLLAPLVFLRPVFWLGCSRGIHLLFHRNSLLGLLVLAAAEALFFSRLHEVYVVAGEPFLGGPDGAAAAVSLHRGFTLGYLALALIAGLIAAATSFHREMQANSLDVFFATPVSNERIVKGLYVASLVSALPLWLLAMLHAMLATVTGSFTLLSTAVLAVTSLVALFHVCAAAFLRGLKRDSPTRATLSGLRTLIQSPNPGRALKDAGTKAIVGVSAVFLIIVVSPFFLLVAAGFWPLGLVAIPLAFASAASGSNGWVPLLLVIPLPFYLESLRVLIQLQIPRQFILKREQRYMPLAMYRRRYLETRRESARKKPVRTRGETWRQRLATRRRRH